MSLYALQPEGPVCLPPGLLQLVLEDIQAKVPPWYRRWSFWGRALSLSASLAFFLAGLVMLCVSPDTVGCIFD